MAPRVAAGERAHHGEASIGVAWSDDLMRWHWPGGPAEYVDGRGRLR